MKRFAVIEGRKVLCVIASDECPVFLSASHVEEVTNGCAIPRDRKLGWDIEAKCIVLMPEMTGKATDQIDGIVRRWLTKDSWLATHTHPETHQGAVLIGEARVRIGQDWFDVTAPWIGDLPANVEHEARVKDGCEKALWASIFPEQVGKN